MKNVRTLLHELKEHYVINTYVLSDTNTNIKKEYNNISLISEYQKNKIVNAYFFSLDKSILMIYCENKKHATP